MKFINENWNAFYSFLITRIVAHNWAACIRLEITSHLRMCGSMCVCMYMHYRTVCVCVCVWKESEKDRHTKRQRWSWMWRKNWSREDRETVNWETEREKWSKIKSIFLWYYTAPFCLCIEQHLLSVCGASVCDETFCAKSSAFTQTKQAHTQSRRHVKLWFEFIVWQHKLHLAEFIDFPRERSSQKAQQQRRSHHWGKMCEAKAKLIRFYFSLYTFSLFICLKMWCFVKDSCQYTHPAVTFHC